MDFLVRLFRVLANPLRLRIAHYIATNPDATTRRVADALALEPNLASRHLKLLADVGVVDRRPTGRFVLNALPSPASAQHSVLKRVRELLLTCFAADGGVAAASRAVSDSIPLRTWQAIFEAMCFDFTAYTHLRRLLIVRYLATSGAGTLTDLASSVGMSVAAAQRHVEKLRRRGLISGTHGRKQGEMGLGRQAATPFRRELLRAVQGHIGGR